MRGKFIPTSGPLQWGCSIDLVVASILMSMGMMMVPPVVVSLPLKLAFFVVADGWSLLAGALIRGYGQ